MNVYSFVIYVTISIWSWSKETWKIFLPPCMEVQFVINIMGKKRDLMSNVVLPFRLVGMNDCNTFLMLNCWVWWLEKNVYDKIRMLQRNFSIFHLVVKDMTLKVHMQKTTWSRQVLLSNLLVQVEVSPSRWTLFTFTYHHLQFSEPLARTNACIIPGVQKKSWL